MSNPTFDELLWGEWPSLDETDRTVMMQTRLADLTAAAERVGDLEFELEGWRECASEAQDDLKRLREEIASLRVQLATAQKVSP